MYLVLFVFCVNKHENKMEVKENKISYSKILIDFIDTILTGQEDETELLSKLTLGQIAWNFSVSNENDLPLDNMHKESFIKITQYNSELKVSNVTKRTRPGQVTVSCWLAVR